MKAREMVVRCCVGKGEGRGNFVWSRVSGLRDGCFCLTFTIRAYVVSCVFHVSGWLPRHRLELSSLSIPVFSQLPVGNELMLVLKSLQSPWATGEKRAEETMG